MMGRPDSARTQRRNQASAMEGLMKEAQREVYNKESAAFAARQRPPSAPSSSSSSSSSRRRQKEEDRQLGIVHADGDSGDEFDDLERICLEEHEASKGGSGDRRRSSPRSSPRSPSTSPRGSMFRQSLADKRRAMDSATRTSRIVTRDDDINALLQDPSGPNLMDALQKRYERHNKARASGQLVRKMAQAANNKTNGGAQGSSRKLALSPQAGAGARASKSPTDRVSKTGNFNPTPSTTITLDQPRRNSRVVRRLRTNNANGVGGSARLRQDKPALHLQLKSPAHNQHLHPHRRHQRSVSTGGGGGSTGGLGLASPQQHPSRRLHHTNPQVAGSSKEGDSEADALLADHLAAGRGPSSSGSGSGSAQLHRQRAKPKRRSSHHRSKSAADGDGSGGAGGAGVKPRTTPVRRNIGRSNIPARSPAGSSSKGASFLTRTASWQLKQLEQKRIRQLAERAAQEKQREEEARDIWSGPGVQTVQEDL